MILLFFQVRPNAVSSPCSPGTLSSGVYALLVVAWLDDALLWNGTRMHADLIKGMEDWLSSEVIREASNRAEAPTQHSDPCHPPNPPNPRTIPEQHVVQEATANKADN